MKLDLSVEGEVKVKAILDFNDDLVVSASIRVEDPNGKQLTSSFTNFSEEALEKVEEALRELHDEVLTHPQLGTLVSTALKHANSGFAIKVGGKTNV